MRQLKLTLRSSCPSTIHSANGKSYVLKPGNNVLDLSDADYEALTKALGIKESPKKEQAKTETLKKEQVKTEETKQEPVKPEESKHESMASEPVKLDNKDEVKQEANLDSKEEALKKESANTDEVKDGLSVPQSTEETDNDNASIEDAVDEHEEKPDYSSMTYQQLKAEYKKVTGKSCKLKRDAVIAFLQGN